MPTLTADQITDFRQLVGDECTEEDISDVQVQAFYDTAYGKSDDSETVEALTVVYILRRLLGKSRKKIDQSSEMQTVNERRSQLFEHLQKLLEYWEGVAGIGGAGALMVGSFDLNIDYTEDDLEAET